MTDRNGTISAGLDTFNAFVEAVNDKGIKIKGQWLDYSKFGSAARVQRPKPGAAVQVTVKGRFVQALEVLEAPEAQEPQEKTAHETLGNTTIGNHALRIVREACLHAASRFCAPRLDLKSADMLTLAERLEAWVLR